MQASEQPVPSCCYVALSGGHVGHYIPTDRSVNLNGFVCICFLDQQKH